MLIFNEKEILRRIAEGDETSFDELFKHYYPKIKTFIFRLLQDENDAEDLTQDIFIRLWYKRENAILIHNLNAYLYKVSRNEVMQHIRRSLVFDEFIASKLHNQNVDENYSVEDDIYAKELIRIIDEIISRMPPQRQKIYLMSRKEHMSIAEIAKVLNINKRTVENHLTLALSDIRKGIPTYIFFLFYI